jgi:hypothetical protein
MWWLDKELTQIKCRAHHITPSFWVNPFKAPHLQAQKVLAGHRH